MESIPPKTRSRIARLQTMQAELQNVILRRKQIEVQLREIENALSELKKAKEAGEEVKVYKAAGPILISAKPDELIKELEDTKELFEIRLKTLERQESMLRKQIEELRERIEQELRGGVATGG